MTAITNDQPQCGYCAHSIESTDTHIFEKCQHIFHKACIDQDLSTCPTCNPKCTICHDLTSEESKTTLTCGHIFHRPCRDKWIETQLLQGKELTCSTCRVPLKDTITTFNASTHGLLKKWLVDYYSNVVSPSHSELLTDSLIGDHTKLIIALIDQGVPISNDIIHETFIEVMKQSTNPKPSTTPIDRLQNNSVRDCLLHPLSFLLITFLITIFAMHQMHLQHLEK